MPVGPDENPRTWSSVTVILPVLDEVDSIDQVISDLLNQDYEDAMELIVADGGSKDGTLAKLDSWAKRDSRLTVIDNPERRQAHGLNRASKVATGEILVRADGHTSFAPDYVRRSVELLSEIGGAVGGRMNPAGRAKFGRAVAAAMKNPLTMGPGRFHHAEVREEVDTVYLGAFRKQDFQQLGGFRAFPSGSSEDADFYYRWRASGRKVFVDPSIRSSYTPRDTAASLWRQYWRYGLGKTEMLWANGEFPSYRPMAPAVLILGLAGGLVWALAGIPWLFLAVVTSWLLLLGSVGLRSNESVGLVMSAAAIMHLSYGLGALWGLVRGPGPTRHLRG